MTADVTRKPTGGQGLDLVTEIVGEWMRTGSLDKTAALPELATLIADAERVRRVRELAHSWERPLDRGHHWYAWHLDRALDGEPQS